MIAMIMPILGNLFSFLITYFLYVVMFANYDTKVYYITGYGIPSLIENMQVMYKLAVLGSFDDIELENALGVQWLGFSMQCIILLVVMLNILIALVCDAYAE